MIPRAGQKATFLYEMPGGIFRRAKVLISSEGLLNEKDKWFHDNQESCIFPLETPIPLETFEQLLNPPDRPAPNVPKGFIAIGEDNGWLPYSTRTVVSWEDIEDRQHRRVEYQEVGRQNAELRNIHRSLGNPLLTTFAWMGAAVMALMVTIIAAVLILTAFGDDGSESALLGMVLLGATATAAPKRRPPKKQQVDDGGQQEAPAAPVACKKSPKEPRWLVYWYDSVTGRKKAYSLPFSEVYHHINPAAWRYPVLGIWKWYGLGAGVLVVVCGMTLMASQAPQTVVLAAMFGPILAVMFGGLGFFFGPKIAPKLSIFNRPYAKVRRYQTEDGGYVLEPMLYTGLTGVEPSQWRFLVRQHLEAVQEAAAEDGEDEVPQFDPIVNRADDAYEDIQGLLEREDTYIPMSTHQKIQIGSIMVMAAGSVITAFFIVMATMGG